MAVALLLLGLLGVLALREALDRELDATLMGVASVQAGSATEPEEGDMRLLEWELTPAEAEAVRDLNRFSQIWTGDGRSLLRSRYLTRDLPLDSAALREAAAGELVWREQDFEGAPVRSLFYPLGRFGPAHEAHVLQVAAPLESRNRMLRDAALFVFLVVLVVTAGTFAGGWWLADRALGPVRQVTDQAEEIGAGTLGHRITAHAETEEYRDLVQVLNGMLQRIDEAFEVQKRFTADASHELRSPLTALRAEIEVTLRRARSPEEYRAVLNSLLEEVERLSRTAEDLLTLARSDAGVMEPRLRPVDLGQIVGRVAERIQKMEKAKSLRIDTQLASELEVLADPDLLDRLIWNLAENAVKFTPEGGAVELALERQGGTPVLEVRDTGPGLTKEDQALIFQRFSRGDRARTRSPDTPGTGLGLAIAHAAAELHGAELTARNRSDQAGAVFRIRFTGMVPERPQPAKTT